jgi:hypothetical protein
MLSSMAIDINKCQESGVVVGRNNCQKLVAKPESAQIFVSLPRFELLFRIQRQLLPVTVTSASAVRATRTLAFHHLPNKLQIIDHAP